jgi:predicted transcriptional regulator
MLVQIDEETSRRLEKVAPARSRARSEFVRQAIRKALWEREEQATAEAYRTHPDDERAYFVAETWEPRTPARRRKQ